MDAEKCAEACPAVCAAEHVRTFLAFNESSEASMVMYFSPPTLTPFAMTPLGSLLSAKESAIVLRSASETCRVVSMRHDETGTLSRRSPH